MGIKKDTLNDIELEMSNEEKDALKEEQKSADRVFYKLNNAYFLAKSNVKYPEISMYKTGIDYDDIEDIQYKKKEQKLAVAETNELSKYYHSTNLYQGHLVSGETNFYFTEDQELSSKTLNGNPNDILVNTEDERYDRRLKEWRFPQEYESVRISRNVELEKQKVIKAVTIFDSESTIYSQINDSFLLATLERNKNNSQLHSIILTIQKKQLNIRSINEDSSFVVQGCAGSGKTVVLLHRLRYLIFNGKISPSSYLYILPNTNMYDYVKDMAYNFKINTNALKTHIDYYKFLLDSNDKTKEQCELLFEEEYLKDAYSEELIRQCYSKLFVEVSNSIKELIVYVENYLEINKELVASLEDKEVLAWLENKDRQKQIIISMQEAILEDMDDYTADLAPCNMFLAEKTEYARKYLNDFLNVSVKVSSIENLDTEKFKLISNYTENQFLAAINRALFGYFRKFLFDKYHKSPSKVYKHYWYLLVYARYLTRNNFDSRYKYIYIDEAQDFAVSELKLIYKINNIDSQPKFNLFGDVNQTISSFGIKDWKELPKYLGSKEIITLDENFRNTNQVVDYCNKNLPFKMTKVGLNMDKVDIYSKYNDFVSLNLSIYDYSLIVKDEEAKTDLIKALDDDVSNNIYTVKDAKGLEFKKVIVFDRDMTDEEKYIAYTRTVNKLIVVKELKRSNIKPEIVEDEYSEDEVGNQEFLNTDVIEEDSISEESRKSTHYIELRGNLEGNYELRVYNSKTDSESILNTEPYDILKNGKKRDGLSVRIDLENRIVYVDKMIRSKYVSIFNSNKKLNVRKR